MNHYSIRTNDVASRTWTSRNIQNGLGPCRSGRRCEHPIQYILRSARRCVVLFKHESRVRIKLAFVHTFCLHLCAPESSPFPATNRVRRQVETKLTSPVTIQVSHYFVCTQEMSCVDCFSASSYAANEIKQIISLIAKIIIMESPSI